MARQRKSEKGESVQSVDQEPIILAEKPAPETTTYFIGVTRDAPIHHITVPAIPGGVAVAFPCHTAEVVETGSGDRKVMALAAPRAGGRIELYSDEFKALRANIAKRFVRWYNREERRGEVVTIEGDKKAAAGLGQPQESMRTTGRNENLEPLAKYLWLLSDKEITPNQAAGGVIPPTIWEVENGREE